MKRRLVTILLVFVFVWSFSAYAESFRKAPYPCFPTPVPKLCPATRHLDSNVVVERLVQQAWTDQTWFLVTVVLAKPEETVKVEREDTCIGSSWAKLVAEAPKPLPPPPPPAPPKVIPPPPPPPPKVEQPKVVPPKVVPPKVESPKPKPVLDPVPFDINKSTINPMGAKVLDKNGAVLKAYPNLKVEIGGHTDKTGTEIANKRISEKRAISCKKYLMDKFGISGDRMTIKAYGSSKPIADNSTAEGRAKNRRVEFIEFTIK